MRQNWFGTVHLMHLLLNIFIILVGVVVFILSTWTLDEAFHRA